ncbi:MAG: hypothetical protein WDM81_06710 [Rhizomicrobium sp.]
MFAWQFSKYLHTQEKTGAAKFVSMQNFYNLVYREEGARDAAALPRRRHRRDPVEPLGARLPRRQSQPRRRGADRRGPSRTRPS